MYFLSPSGTGKLFLFDILIEYFKENSKNVVLINNSMLSNLNGKLNVVQSICLDPETDIVILDSADLYLTQDFLDQLSAQNKQVFISIKHSMGLNFKKNGFYIVKYDNNLLQVRRRL